MPTGDRPDAILTTGEAAELCGVSRSTLRRAVAQGQLAAWRTPGKHLRFSRIACAEFAREMGRVDLPDSVDVVGRPHPRPAVAAAPVGRAGAASRA